MRSANGTKPDTLYHTPCFSFLIPNNLSRIKFLTFPFKQRIPNPNHPVSLAVVARLVYFRPRLPLRPQASGPGPGIAQIGKPANIYNPFLHFFPPGEGLSPLPFLFYMISAGSLRHLGAARDALLGIVVATALFNTDVIYGRSFHPMP